MSGALKMLAAGLALHLANAPGVSAEPLRCGDGAADASRIAVAGGSIVEVLYELGEGDRIAAVDRTATWPPEAQALPQIGYVRNLSAEGLLSVEPTLILAEHDAGPPEVIEQLRRLGVDMLLVPEAFSVAGIEAKVRCVATAIGETRAGERLLASLPAEIRADRPAPEADAPAGVVLLGLRGGAPVAAGRDTSGHGLLAMAGARNLMSFEGWKPVSEEAMAAARPAFIVIPERGVDMAGGLDALLNHPALRLTPAARTRAVISMDGMAMLGFGLRTLGAAEDLRAALAAGSPPGDPSVVPDAGVGDE